MMASSSSSNQTVDGCHWNINQEGEEEEKEEERGKESQVLGAVDVLWLVDHFDMRWSKDRKTMTPVQGHRHLPPSFLPVCLCKEGEEGEAKLRREGGGELLNDQVDCVF